MAPDVAERARQWSLAGLVDVEFYSALRGRDFGDGLAAAADFVSVGMPERLSSHPLLDFHSLPPDVRRAWRRGRTDLVLGHLRSGTSYRLSGPLVEHPEQEAGRAHLVDLAGHLSHDDGIFQRVPSADGRPTLASVVVVAPDLQPAARAVHRVRSESSAGEVEILVVDHGTPAHAALGLHARLVRDGAAVVRVPRSLAEPDALEIAVSQARGRCLVVLPADIIVRPGWLRPLVEAMEDGAAGAVPLVLDERDLIAGAGPLHGHPPEDAVRLGDRDLGPGPHRLALVPRCGAGTVQEGARWPWVPQSRVTTLDASSATPLSVPVGDAGEPDSLRWSLSLPSPPGVRGDTWGDTYFAAALARALERQGERVVTRRRGAHDAGPTELDDVNLALRGLHRITPAPGKINVLWVISHPDDVELDELDGYDVVCAASRTWSERLSTRTGRPVTCLLQASEFRRPTSVSVVDPAMVFVGNVDARRDRPMVRAAVEAGVPLAVHGRGWDGLPAGVWRGEHVDNLLLPEVYRRHGVVLADHWEDMAREGFVANRVFDALAAGARVISDEVAGLEGMFAEGAVEIAPTPAAIRAAYERFRAERDEIGVAHEEVSFDARARTLRDLVRSV